MMVRRYVVKDMPEAVVLIRKDIGKDAVILSTKRIRIKKMFGLWRSKRIEVMAAAGSDVPIRTSIPQFQDAIRETASSNVTESPVLFSSDKGSDAVLGVISKDGAERVLVPQNKGSAFPSNQVDTPEQTASEVGMARVLDNITEMKQMLEVVLATQDGMWSALISHLRAQGMTDDRIMNLVRAGDIASDGFSGATRQEALLRDDLATRILERLHHIKDAQPIAQSSRLVAFVGPTGVGKTTTVAKLAALHVLAGKRKVGLVTTDTFRIAAVEQLRTYAGILNIPIEVVHKPSEMQTALERLRNCDLVLIDTAGRNFLVDGHLHDVRSMLQSFDIDETYLVLSMTSKPEDLDTLAASFCQIPIDKFLFTKMDETTSYGAILNLLLTYQKPISYVTTGQNVPDDIEVASLEKLLHLVIGGVA